MAGYSLPNSIAVVMAGGSGTRFWPLSQPHLPKQYLKLFGDNSLIVDTVNRMRTCVTEQEVVICSAANQKALLSEHFSKGVKLVLEPMGKNTAICLMLTLARLLKDGVSPDTVMVAVPADAHIADEGRYQSIIRKAIALAHETKGLVTLGIVPDSPHTGYGYIEAGEGFTKGSFRVARFVEKPNLEKAQQFLREKTFFWNAGIFAWELGALKTAFETYCENLWNEVYSANDEAALTTVYQNAKSVPIDIAVLEKSKNIYMIPADFGWSDVGSWNALYSLKADKVDENIAISGTMASIDSQGCLVHVPEGKKVALVGVEDLIVVENEDTILVAHRSKDQKVKDAVGAFNKDAQ